MFLSFTLEYYDKILIIYFVLCKIFNVFYFLMYILIFFTKNLGFFVFLQATNTLYTPSALNLSKITNLSCNCLTFSLHVYTSRKFISIHSSSSQIPPCNQPLQSPVDLPSSSHCYFS